MVRTVAVLLLALLVLLLALPLGIGMAMSGCPDCHPPGGATVLGACAALVWTLSLSLVILSVALRRAALRVPSLLLAPSLDHPPRTVAVS